MVIQEVIRQIDEFGGTEPFLITITKADGIRRDMVCLKRNKQRMQGGKSADRTAFKYSLKQKGAILVNELLKFKTVKKETPEGTHYQLAIPFNPQEPLGKAPAMAPKSIKKFSIRSFNQNPVHHV